MKALFQIQKISSVRVINVSTRWITFDNVINADPGQFVMVWLPDIGEKPFSIAGMDPFSLLVVDVGPFSHALHTLDVSDEVWVKGPLGHGFKLEGEHLLFVAGGYGAAPLYPLAVLARKEQRKVDACFGSGTESGLVFVDEFGDLGCEIVIATEDGSRGKLGLVTALVADAFNQFEYDGLYACGPAGMLSALADLCREHQVNYQLSWEAHMRCGMGLCGSCEVPRKLDPSLPPGWLACYDGPVFIKRWE
ncbi:MAG: dihydroorotate dehydrogenase electron transfer subunit [Chloroflexota bacterium]|nr:dihydroorotate dehydrogenase electron transfer subunit [Chloroflexota bacterium]